MCVYVKHTNKITYHHLHVPAYKFKFSKKRSLGNCTQVPTTRQLTTAGAAVTAAATAAATATVTAAG